MEAAETQDLSPVRVLSCLGSDERRIVLSLTPKKRTKGSPARAHTDGPSRGQLPRLDERGSPVPPLALVQGTPSDNSHPSAGRMSSPRSTGAVRRLSPPGEVKPPRLELEKRMEGNRSPAEPAVVSRLGVRTRKGTSSEGVASAGKAGSGSAGPPKSSSQSNQPSRSGRADSGARTTATAVHHFQESGTCLQATERTGGSNTQRSEPQRAPATMSQRSTVGVSQLEIELTAANPASQLGGMRTQDAVAARAAWGVSQLEIMTEGATQFPRALTGATLAASEPMQPEEPPVHTDILPMASRSCPSSDAGKESRGDEPHGNSCLGRSPTAQLTSSEVATKPHQAGPAVADAGTQYAGTFSPIEHVETATGGAQPSGGVGRRSEEVAPAVTGSEVAAVGSEVAQQAGLGAVQAEGLCGNAVVKSATPARSTEPPEDSLAMGPGDTQLVEDDNPTGWRFPADGIIQDSEEPSSPAALLPPGPFQETQILDTPPGQSCSPPGSPEKNAEQGGEGGQACPTHIETQALYDSPVTEPPRPLATVEEEASREALGEEGEDPAQPSTGYQGVSGTNNQSAPVSGSPAAECPTAELPATAMLGSAAVAGTDGVSRPASSEQQAGGVYSGPSANSTPAERRSSPAEGSRGGKAQTEGASDVAVAPRERRPMILPAATQCVSPEGGGALHGVFVGGEGCDKGLRVSTGPGKESVQSADRRLPEVGSSQPLGGSRQTAAPSLPAAAICHCKATQDGEDALQRGVAAVVEEAAQAEAEEERADTSGDESFGMEDVLLTMAATQGEHGWLTCSMMEESEGGASQLQPLESTAAEADYLLEDVSKKLMSGLVEGGLFYFHSLALERCLHKLEGGQPPVNMHSLRTLLLRLSRKVNEDHLWSYCTTAEDAAEAASGDSPLQDPSDSLVDEAAIMPCLASAAEVGFRMQQFSQEGVLHLQSAYPDALLPHLAEGEERIPGSAGVAKQGGEVHAPDSEVGIVPDSEAQAEECSAGDTGHEAPPALTCQETPFTPIAPGSDHAAKPNMAAEAMPAAACRTPTAAGALSREGDIQASIGARESNGGVTPGDVTPEGLVPSSVKDSPKEVPDWFNCQPGLPGVSSAKPPKRLLLFGTETQADPLPAFPRRKPLQFHGTEELPAQPEASARPSISGREQPGGSEVSRVPDTCPEAPSQNGGAVEAAPPVEPVVPKERERVPFKEAAKAAGLKKPLVSSQPGGSRENVKRKLHTRHRQRKQQLLSERKQQQQRFGPGTRVLQTSQPPGIAEKANRSSALATRMNMPPPLAADHCQGGTEPEVPAQAKGNPRSGSSSSETSNPYGSDSSGEEDRQQSGDEYPLPPIFTAMECPDTPVGRPVAGYTDDEAPDDWTPVVHCSPRTSSPVSTPDDPSPLADGVRSPPGGGLEALDADRRGTAAAAQPPLARVLDLPVRANADGTGRGKPGPSTAPKRTSPRQPPAKRQKLAEEQPAGVGAPGRADENAGEGVLGKRRAEAAGGRGAEGSAAPRSTPGRKAGLLKFAIWAAEQDRHDEIVRRARADPRVATRRGGHAGGTKVKSPGRGRGRQTAARGRKGRPAADAQESDDRDDPYRLPGSQSFPGTVDVHWGQRPAAKQAEVTSPRERMPSEDSDQGYRPERKGLEAAGSGRRGSGRRGRGRGRGRGPGPQRGGGRAQPAGRPQRKIQPPSRFRDTSYRMDDLAPEAHESHDLPAQDQEDCDDAPEESQDMSPPGANKRKLLDTHDPFAKSVTVEGGSRKRKVPESSNGEGAASPPPAATRNTRARKSLEKSAAPEQPEAAVKLGCSKCRHSKSGCRACCAKAGVPFLPPAERLARLSLGPHAAPKPGRGRPAKRSRLSEPCAATPAPPLEGWRVLVSCKGSGPLKDSIMALGGTVLPTLPSYQEAGLEEPPAAHLVVTDSTVQDCKSSKIMLAFILGLPVVRPSWVHACVGQNAEASSAQHYAWGPPKAPWKGLEGMRVYVHSSTMLPTIKTLLEYAGAELVDRFATSPSPSRSRRVADLIFLEREECTAEVLSTQDDEEKDEICTKAALLGIPVHDKRWLVSVICKGGLEGKPLGPLIDDQVEAQQPPAMPARKRTASPPEPAAAAGPSRALQGATGLGQGQQGSHGGGKPEQRRAHPFRWMAAADGPPAGLGLEDRRHRIYYKGFFKDGAIIRLNSFVELIPAPGEVKTRVACVEALWGDPGGPSNPEAERRRGRFRIFYRPEETSFYKGFKNEVLRTDHIEPRLSLEAVSSICSVQQEPKETDAASWALIDSHGRNLYHCIMQYCHKNEGLFPLPRDLPVQAVRR